MLTDGEDCEPARVLVFLQVAALNGGKEHARAVTSDVDQPRQCKPRTKPDQATTYLVAMLFR